MLSGHNRELLFYLLAFFVCLFVLRRSQWSLSCPLSKGGLNLEQTFSSPIEVTQCCFLSFPFISVITNILIML